MRVKASFPEPFRKLFTPKRYKAPYGGRGSAKSWSIAEALILIALEPRLLFPKASKIRILCTREIQNSIKESVHKLLSDTIERLKLGHIFIITNSSIICHNGSEFIFMGLLRNVDQIKSTEGINICWVSEAHNVSDESWDLLMPTIRAEDSEIWIDFNPKYEHDATYQRWVVNPPENCISWLVNYTDNPYFPEVLRVEMEVLVVLEAAAGEEDGQIFLEWLLASPRLLPRKTDVRSRRLESSSFDWRSLVRRSRTVFMASIATILSWASLAASLPWCERS